ncbi:MAG: hypothetical protein PHI97_18480 [Desulfobulbus sp.]|nr:hypothetical protein [Desulfobulbus sp.]
MVIFSLEFTVLRFLVLTGLIRLIFQGGVRLISWNYFDKLVVAWAFAGSSIYILQQGTGGAIINRCGFMFDVLGMYLLFRISIRTWGDVFTSIKIFAIFAIITAPLIALEKFQESSFFSLFGHVEARFHRDRFRASGPFSHHIIMGCFWATLLPMFYASIKIQKNMVLFGLAIMAVLSNVYFSGSSTPIMTVIAVMLFWLLYTYRMYGMKIFQATCFTLFALHLIMKAPVWHLLSRVNVFSGSTGWHRYILFDNFVTHIPEWFLLGTKDTAHWGYGQQDLTNQFVLEGVRGGMITLLVFVALVYQAVKIPGRVSLDNTDLQAHWFSWAICTAMFGHFVTFWGVSYFGQINMLLYFTFALVGFALERELDQSNVA